MAPIPSRLPEEVLSLLSSTERRYNYVSGSVVPELRRCNGPLSHQQRLTDDVREDTLELSRQIEALDMMVDDQPGDKNRKELRQIVNDWQRKLENLRKDTRAALLASKRAIDSNLRSKREELLARPSVLNEKQTANEKTAEDALMQANSDVTDALRRTISLMQSELQRSVLSTQLLDESTASLRATSLQHDTLNSVMTTSKQLVTALEKSDWLDRILILSGFGFFILVVLFILKQRIVDRGLRMAFWWTRFVPSFNDDMKLLRSAEKGMASAIAEASSTFATVTSSIASAVIPISSIAPTLVASFSMVEIPSSSVASHSDSPQESPTLIPSEIGDASIFNKESSASSLAPNTTPSDLPIHVEL